MLLDMGFFFQNTHTHTHRANLTRNAVIQPELCSVVHRAVGVRGLLEQNSLEVEIFIQSNLINGNFFLIIDLKIQKLSGS